MSDAEIRRDAARAKRIVVKIGSALLVEQAEPRRAWLDRDASTRGRNWPGGYLGQADACRIRRREGTAFGQPASGIRPDGNVDFPTLDPAKQGGDIEILRTDTVERGKPAAEHMIAPREETRAVERPDIRDFLDHAQRARIAARIGANAARVAGIDIAACRAGFEPFFDGFPPVHAWLARAQPDVAVVFYNDHGLNFFLDKMPTFAVGAARLTRCSAHPFPRRRDARDLELHGVLHATDHPARLVRRRALHRTAISRHRIAERKRGVRYHRCRGHIQ